MPIKFYIPPTLLMFCAILWSSLPTVELNGHFFGGGPVRQWLVNYLILPVLPKNAAHYVRNLFMEGGYYQEIMVSTVTIMAYLLPLYVLVYLFLKGRKNNR